MAMHRAFSVRSIRVVLRAVRELRRLHAWAGRLLPSMTKMVRWRLPERVATGSVARIRATIWAVPRIGVIVSPAPLVRGARPAAPGGGHERRARRARHSYNKNKRLKRTEAQDTVLDMSPKGPKWTVAR